LNATVSSAKADFRKSIGAPAETADTKEETAAP
jgi:hypothetical protein